MLGVRVRAVHAPAVKDDAASESEWSIVDHDDINLVSMQQCDDVRRHANPRIESRACIRVARMLEEHRHVDIAVSVAASFAVAAEKPNGLHRPASRRSTMPVRSGCV